MKILKIMKSRALSVFCAVSLVAVTVFSVFAVSAEKKQDIKYDGVRATIKQYTDFGEYIASMKIAAEDNKAILYFDPDTANIALFNKADSSIWYSAPVLNEGFSSAVAAQQKLMLSPVIIKFTDSKLQEHTLNSFGDSAAFGQLKHKKSSSGVSFTMTIGKLSSSEIVPQVLTQDRLDELEEKLEKADFRYIKQSYRKIELKGDKEDEIKLTDYPGVKDGVVYTLRANTGESIKKKLGERFSKAGYTRAMLEADEKAVYGKLKTEQEVTANFTLNLNYTLENGELVASVNMGDIAYDEKKFTLLDVELLKFFGAADINDSGFFLLPDGSGVISEYKSGVTASGSPFKTELYGRDSTYQYDPSLHNYQNALFSMFGQSKGDSGFIAIAEKGDAQMAVRSVIDESESLMRYTNFICHARLSSKYVHSEYASHDEYVKSTENAYEGELKQRYIFLKDASYSNMANTYRNYLLQNKKLVKSDSDYSRVYLEILGAIEVNESNSISNTVLYPLTTYKNTEKIINELSENGLLLDVKLTGWANGGIDYTIFNKAKLVSKLGSKNNFKAMLESADKNNANIYPSVDFSYALKNSMFDGFTPAFNATHQLDNSYGRVYNYNIGSNLGKYSDIIYTIKSQSMLKYSNKFLKKYKYNSTGLTIMNMGEVINSDCSKKSASRTDALNDYKKIFKELSCKYKLQIEGGNQYSWSYASAIRDLPNGSSNYRNTSVTIPFVQMLLHGNLPYSSTPLNMANNYEYALLKAIENGEQLTFTVGKDNLQKITASKHTEYNSVDYDYWKEKIIADSKKLNKILDGTFDKLITEHKYLTNDVVKVTYENGTEIIVNYSYEPYNFESINIPARDAVAIKN